MIAPVWLFSGPEIGERTAAIQKLKKTLQEQGLILDTHSFYASQTPVSAFIDILQNGSLFADSRFIVLKNAEAIKKKDDIELLAQWIRAEHIPDSAFLILVSDEISIDKKLESLIPKEHKTIFWELFEHKKHEWIRRFFTQACIRIHDDAIRMLLELVENNTEELKKICFRISLFVDPNETLTSEYIEKLLSHTKEETAFTLFNALSNKNFEQALSIQQKLLLSKEHSAVTIIAGLSYCFRRLQDWHHLAAHNMCTDVHLKRIGISSKKAIEQYRRASVVWTNSAVCRILALLHETDMAIRSIQQDMHTVIMEHCLYAITIHQGKTPHTQYAGSQMHQR